ncbi:hypothetical protein [Nocardia blacklockiae]|uniref:hypothetical protein n=1 Tax=Nocardia blacklockiae TaxID=480036 RepID=UPI00189536B7|nr:hypothetical protein [Nocardia blacklockiae]MBF6173609.1 hypothetical protein [Nocardia blacklockiae]
MPKNSSARRRQRARVIAAEEGVRKYREALRRGDERAAAPARSPLRPRKFTIDGVDRYARRADAVALAQDDMRDPAGTEVVAGADVLRRQVRALLSVRLKPVTVAGEDGPPTRVVQCERPEVFRAEVREILSDLARVREDADIADVAPATVAITQHLESRLHHLDRTTGGPLRARVRDASDTAESLFATVEAVHSRGCRLGAGENRHRRGWGYTPCGGGLVRIRVRIFDYDDTIVTDAGCPRHAAEEIVSWDADVEYYGTATTEIMGGTDTDLDTIYDLADAVRHERIPLRIAREAEMKANGTYRLPSPPWMRHDAY